jgi:S1-C subfamily serine protease
MVMAEPVSPLTAFSDQVAALVERASASIVAVHGGGRWSSSGVHWRPGVIITAEDVLERDEQLTVTLPGGRKVAASLAGRDPSTDVAVLRIEAQSLPVAATADTASLRPGHVIVAVGSFEGAPAASFGLVGIVGSAWQSLRGGTIDSLLRLDLALDARAEGGAVVDTRGRVVGMTVSGPRRRVLAIPTATIDRAVDQLLAKGYVGRGYFGAGLQRVRLARQRNGEHPAEGKHGILIVSIDPDGPAARAGLVIGDIVTAWNARPLTGVRDVIRLLGPNSVGNTVDLHLLRGGAPKDLKIVIGERRLA